MELDALTVGVMTRCPECDAPLVVPDVGARDSAATATCTACAAVFDLEGLQCVLDELDAVNDEMVSEIRRVIR